MEGKDNIKELFSQKLGNYEAKVNPELWAKISSQVAAGATTTVAAGLSLFTKIAIGIGVSAAAIATVVVINSTDAPNENKTPEQEVSNEAQTDQPQTEEVVTINESVQPAVSNAKATGKQTLAPSTKPTSGLNPPRETFPEVNRLIPNRIPRLASDTKEPTIVQGITYAGMTNYGKPSSNLPEDVSQESTLQPIKKYPNVFTPNGDKENDLFFLESEGLTDFSIVVFDPKGDIVFKSTDPAFTWNGLDIRSGEIVPDGTYMYMVSAYDSEGNPFPIYEQLTIKR